MTRKELFGEMVGHVTNITATAGNGQVTLKWTDPEDSVYQDVTLPWAGTRIVRKEGGYPENENDGIIVVDSTVRNQYSADGFVDSGLTNDTQYYYKAFPYAVVYNLDEANDITATPTYPLKKYDVIAGLYQNVTADFGGTISKIIVIGDFIFIANIERIIKVNKTTFQVVASSALYGAGETIHTMAISGEYIYAAGSSGLIKKYTLSDLSYISSSAKYGARIYALAISGEYIYAGGIIGTINKYQTSDFTLVATSENYGGWIATLEVSGDYIFAAGYTTAKVKKYSLDSLTCVAESPIFGASGITISHLAISGEYIYVAGAKKYIRRYHLSDLTLAGESPTLDNSIYSIFTTEDSIYVGTGKQVQKFNILDLSRMASSIDFNNRPNALFYSDKFIYVGISTVGLIKASDNIYVLE